MPIGKMDSGGKPLAMCDRLIKMTDEEKTNKGVPKTPTNEKTAPKINEKSTLKTNEKPTLRSNDKTNDSSLKTNDKSNASKPDAKADVKVKPNTATDLLKGNGLKPVTPNSKSLPVKQPEPDPVNPFGVKLRPAPVKKPLEFALSSDEELGEEEEEEEEDDEEEVTDDSEYESEEEVDFGKKNNQQVRSTFRPPWVKDETSNKVDVPWKLNRRVRELPKKEEVKEEVPAFQMPTLRKTSQSKIQPLQENGEPKEKLFVKPQLKPVPPKEENTKLQSKEVKIPIKLNSLADRLQREESIKRATFSREDAIDNGDIEKAIPSKRNDLVRQESMKKLQPPKAPPMPPPAPAMPLPFPKKDLNETQTRALEALRSRPKTRPDWTGLLKDIEGGRKLKHVQCNDRSQPLLPKTRLTEGKFLYESEKQNAHNELLNEIKQGRALKKVKTNDRSKPFIEGLRKFRRQMTIEEQIQKSVSMASIPPQETITDEADEMDDIDKVRDDLQSTKQLLAIELRNKEAQERENKKLLAKILNLEAELEKAKSAPAEGRVTSSNDADEKVIKSLKSEAEAAHKISEELEKKYTATAEQLDSAKAEMEELRRQKLDAERKLQELLSGKRMSIAHRQESVRGNESEEENFYEESEPESDGEDTEEKREKKALRELKMLRNKLRTYKTKEDNAKKERAVLKDLMKKAQIGMKEEKKKFKSLQKEVNKISAMMKESSDDEDLEEEEEKDEEKDETETESESESESSEGEDESDSEKSQSEAEDAPNDKKKENLSHRTKRHENILNALKKGNFMLKTNVERLQDDLNKQKEMTASLQDDLDSVLSELG